MWRVRACPCFREKSEKFLYSLKNRGTGSNCGDLTVRVPAQRSKPLGSKNLFYVDKNPENRVGISESYVLDSKLCHCLPQWNPNAAGI